MLKLNNITKSPLTTILGLLIIIASIASVFVTELQMDWTDAGIGVALGAAFLFAPDGKKSGGKAAMIVFLMSGTCLSSCVTYEKCQDKFGVVHDTTYVHKEVKIVVHDTIVKAADTVGAIIKWRNNGKVITDTVIVENPATGMALKYWRDQAGRLRAQCESKQDTVIVTNTVTKKVKVDCPPVTHFEPKPTPWYAKWWFWMCMGVVIWIVIITLFKTALKAIFK